MKKPCLNAVKKVLPVFLLSLIAFSVPAQKLPKVQKGSVRAPDTIKLDGKATEWNDQFQAYNLGNHLYYTVSNDDNNIYLTAHMDDIVGSRKIFRGGLTFTIVRSSKKADRLSITFPAIPTKKTDEMGRLADGPIVYRILKDDTVANKAKMDSLITTSNKLINSVYNQIQVTGIPRINDPLISVYNTQGIKVGASVDKKMRYTYELAIPLKYLGAAINNGEKFKYNIMLNEEPRPEVKSVSFAEPLQLGDPVGPSSADDLFLYDITDFSGEYTLTK